MTESHDVRFADPDHPLTVAWREVRPTAIPLSYWLGADSERWVRFHSLPGSKEVPDTEQERDELLHRHQTLIGELHRTHPVAFLYRTRFTESDLANPDNELWWLATGLEWTDWCEVWERDWDGEPQRLVVATTGWPSAWSDPWLLGTAAERLGQAVLVGAGGSWLAAPYPGGIDIVAGSADEGDGLRTTFSEWLPA